MWGSKWGTGGELRIGCLDYGSKITAERRHSRVLMSAGGVKSGLVKFTNVASAIKKLANNKVLSFIGP